jgi:hypothetical protein
MIMCVVVAVASLLLSTAAMAQTNSSCNVGRFTVETDGLVYLIPSDCDNGGEPCTEITYEVSGGNPDHVAAVVASASTDCDPENASILDVYGDQVTGNQWYAPAVGDPITGLGKWACHEEAAKVNPSDTVSNFTIQVSGVRNPAPKSVVVKKGGKVNSCEIVGIGEIGAISPVVELLCNQDCCLEILVDRDTGAVLSVGEAAENPSDCDICSFPVEQLEVVIDGQSFGFANVASGYIESGAATSANLCSPTKDASDFSKAVTTTNCLTRLVYGRVVTICR